MAAPLAALRAWAARPSLSRAAATSASLMALGDAGAQAMAHAGSDARWDAARTARFAAVGGALSGPFFYKGLNWLGALPLPAALSGGLREALARALVGQVTLFPASLAALHGGLAVLEGRAPADAARRLGDAMAHTYLPGMIWLPVNAVGFAYVPPNARLLYVSARGRVRCCCRLLGGSCAWLARRKDPTRREHN
jgi:hypothetical protein